MHAHSQGAHNAPIQDIALGNDAANTCEFNFVDHNFVDMLELGYLVTCTMEAQ